MWNLLGRKGLRMGGEFSHFFNVKNMILTHIKDFCETNCPNSRDFEKKYFSFARFLQQLPAGSSQNIKQFLKFSTFTSGI